MSALVIFLLVIVAITATVGIKREKRKPSRPMTEEKRQHKKRSGDFYQDEAAHQQHRDDIAHYQAQQAAIKKQFPNHDPWDKSNQG